MIRSAVLAAAALALLSPAACVQNRTLGQGLDDVGADINIKQQLLRDRTIDTSDVDVAIFEGRMLLAGTVPTQADKTALYDKAKAIASVREVLDEVRVGPKTTVRQGAADALIDEKLGAALFTDNGVFRSNYSLVVSQGTVYILGIAQGPNELSRVTQQASAVSGVRDVVSHVVFVGDPRRSAIKG